MSAVRIYIESVSVLVTQVFPTWSGRIDRKRDSKEVFFIDELSGDFRFTKTEYTLIKDIPDCERVEIYMEEYCGAAWVERWRGYFTTYDVKFNESTCEATVDPIAVNDYECFLDQIDTEYTIEYVTSVVVRSVSGTYEAGLECCDIETDINDPEPVGAVCAVPANMCFDKNKHKEIPQEGIRITVSCFHRILGEGTAFDPPPYDTGWTYTGAGILWWRCPGGNDVNVGVFSRGRVLNDVLDDLATRNDCGLTVRSHFLGMNATHAAAPVNDAYTYATTYMQNLTIHQKSDIKRPDASDPAEDFVWKLTWKKFLDDLKTMFNVFWIIDGTDLIIEHLSYFEATAGLDLSTSNFVVNYGKQEGSAPNKEYFWWADSAAFSTAHKGYPIEYGACGTGKEDRRINLFSNDVIYIRTVENQAEISDAGFCLVTTEIISGTYFMKEGNDPLGWVMLHDNLHREGRYFIDGTMNLVPETFNTIKRTRKMEPFKVDICCSDGWDALDYITTKAGIVDVSKATIDYFSGKENNIVTIESVI